MTVKELREKLAGLPDDMPVLVEYDDNYEKRDVFLARAGKRNTEWNEYWYLEGGNHDGLVYRDALIMARESFDEGRKL